MTSAALSREDVARIVREKFDTGGIMVDEHTYQFVVYDAFVMRARADDYGSGNNWGFAVHLGAEHWATSLLGQRIILCQTRDDILDRLATIDHWCRLRLGSEYLAAYEAAKRSRRSTPRV